MKIQLAVLVILATNAFAERPINEQPMFGGQHEPKVEINQSASADVTKRAWQAYAQGDFDTAIKRFNQAWMFDRNNAQAYWGFGLVMGQRSSQTDPETNLRESVRFLEMARKLDSKNARIIGDLAFSHTVLGQFLKTEAKDETEANKEFSAAETLFAQAHKLEGTYPPIAANWSILKFYTGNYSTAKTLLDEARAAGYQPDPAYQSELDTKLK